MKSVFHLALKLKNRLANISWLKDKYSKCQDNKCKSFDTKTYLINAKSP